MAKQTRRQVAAAATGDGAPGNVPGGGALPPGAVAGAGALPPGAGATGAVPGAGTPPTGVAGAAVAGASLVGAPAAFGVSWIQQESNLDIQPRSEMILIAVAEEPRTMRNENAARMAADPIPKWAMSSEKYAKKAIDAVEKELGTEQYGYKYLPNKVSTPLTSNYRPEVDVTAELDPSKQNYYQGLIGVLRWLCELGRLDLVMPVSLMSRYLAQARTGHLNQVLHMFAYLKAHARSKLVFDETRPGETRFPDCDWSVFYPDAKEVLPPDAPEALEKAVNMSCFVDADHAGCKATRRFLNRAPIMWFSKRQTTVETSTFGFEIEQEQGHQQQQQQELYVL